MRSEMMTGRACLRAQTWWLRQRRRQHQPCLLARPRRGLRDRTRRDIRRIFATEAIVPAVLGWLIATPVGLLLDMFLIWMTKQVVRVEVPFTFPAWNVAVALVGTILLALLITLVPIRRAVASSRAMRALLPATAGNGGAASPGGGWTCGPVPSGRRA